MKNPKKKASSDDGFGDAFYKITILGFWWLEYV